VQQAEGKLDDAVRTLTAALKIPGVRSQPPQPAQTPAPPAAKRKVARRPITLSDRVSPFLELAKVFSALNNQTEAMRVVQDALNEFRGTSEELRVVIANADMLVQRNDIDGAMRMLSNITPDNAYYVAAREKLASIHLHSRKDKRQYANCYRELLETLPNAHTHLLLGDAYMSILEPEKAIAVYEEALKKNPRDGVLASKIGHALIKTHDYSKAINYYEAAVKSGEQVQLRGDLAEVYIKLKKFDQAERVIASGLEHDESSDLQVMMSDVRFYLLMARLHTASARPMVAILTLLKAKETQTTIIGRVALEQPEALKQQQQIAAGICIVMAEHHEATPGESRKAIACYQDALASDESNVQAMLALATIHLGAGDLEAAAFNLTNLLRTDKSNNDATVMLADLMFRKQEYDQATFHFQQLLERSPDHYEALARLVELLRRAGKLAMCPKFLDQAEKSSTRAATEPGFNYCRGLHKQHTFANDDALKAFNLARKDAQYGVRATYNMVDIYLNPDNETIGSEVFSGRPLDPANIHNAETLLEDLARMGEGKNERYIAQAALAKLLTRQKSGMEKALDEYTSLSRGLETDAKASLGMARAHILLKQKDKARTLLKVIANMEWTPKHADDFEACLLLFADQQIESGKLDLAQSALKKVLLHNKSCSRGWEYMGYIMEKDLNFPHAAEFYENAWNFCNQSDPAVGYKLAFNFLKAKRHVDAIDVCHMVLEKTPDYPKIRKEIMDKARLMIRV
jgi:tetratricopeptide repeat protein 21B